MWGVGGASPEPSAWWGSGEEALAWNTAGKTEAESRAGPAEPRKLVTKEAAFCLKMKELESVQNHET